MSEFHVEVVRLGPIEKHPNADQLEITHVRGNYPVIVRKGEYKEGDKAVYIPIDSMVPGDDPRWSFLAGHNRIKAKRLRGIFSMGLLTQADPNWEVGQNVQEQLCIVKYEPPVPLGMQTENESCPFDFPVYTDVEGLRKYPDILVAGEEVILTEKIHGANGRWLFKDGRLWVGSHKMVKKEDPTNLWWRAAYRYQLAEILANYPNIVLYGEVFGPVQDLRYGAGKNDLFLAFFDALNLDTREFLDFDIFSHFINSFTLRERLLVPVLYRGPWNYDKLYPYSNGKTTYAKAGHCPDNHCREGFVVKPIKERYDLKAGRCVFKLVGEDYLLRKNA